MSVKPEAVKAAAMVRMRQYESEYSLGNLTWQNFADEVSEVLEAAFAAASEQFPVASRCECGGLARHQDKCRWRQGYGSVVVSGPSVPP